MRPASLLTILLLFIISIPLALMQDDAPAEVDVSSLAIPATQSIPLTSVTNGADYVLKIALPASYDGSQQAYPVLYLLDPSVSFLSVTELVRWSAFWGELPELIVVGIGYPSDNINDVLPLRDRDYFQAQDDFLQIITQEIFPLIDSTYRTDPADRALVGYSLGGEFALNTLVNAPETFNRYVAIDSVYSAFGSIFAGNDTPFRQRLAGLDVKLFFASTGQEILSAAIQNQDYDGLEATGLSLGDITHAAALHIALPAGIQAVYSD
jgi:predicted alpha/beta superfamily hydrolase